jgi:hypothetical protein
MIRSFASPARRLLLRFAIAAAFGTALSATASYAHPDHSGSMGAPWYRYLPPGTPVPAAPTNP